MKSTRVDELLLYIDSRIDTYQMQYSNGIEEVGVYLRDLQKIRSDLAQYSKENCKK